MESNLLKKSFCIFFLGIFFVKMLLSATPLFLSGTDSEAVNAVIMQLEIEDNNEKFPEKIKSSLTKEYCTDLLSFSFHNHSNYIVSVPVQSGDGKHATTFYPSVPTPPPNI